MLYQDPSYYRHVTDSSIKAVYACNVELHPLRYAPPARTVRRVWVYCLRTRRPVFGRSRVEREDVYEGD